MYFDGMTLLNSKYATGMHIEQYEMVDSNVVDKIVNKRNNSLN